LGFRFQKAALTPEPTIRLIAGLGNPGREYEHTRHNAGFLILDRLARRAGAAFASERKFEGHLAKSGGLLLLKPQTFMNLSGRSVAAVAQFFRIRPEEILVVYDDVALPEGKLRLRLSGSAGGHNGMRSMIACLGTDEFPRLRFGVGGSDGKGLVGHVLGRWEPGQLDALDKSLENAADAISMAALRGMAAAMNHYNREEKPAPAAPKKPRPAAPSAPLSPPSTSLPPNTPPHES
jgi:peptidyl-tRNA hydrolase, PTH1 family